MSNLPWHLRSYWLPVIWLAAIIVACVGVSRLQPTGDLAQLLPDRDPVVNEYRKLTEQFDLLRTVFLDVGLREDEQLNRQTRRAMLDAAVALQAELEASGLFERIVGQTSSSQGFQLLDFMHAHEAIYFDEDAKQRIEQRIEDPQAIDAAIEETYRSLLSPAGTLGVEALRRDPLGFDADWQQRAKAMTPQIAQVQFTEGWIASSSGRQVLLLAVPNADDLTPLQIQQTLDRAAEVAKQTAGPVQIEIRSTSTYRSTLDNTTTIRRDVMRVSVMTVLMLIVVTSLMFVRLWFVPLAFVPAAAGVLLAMGVFGFIDPTLPTMVLGFGGALVAITIDMGIHIVTQWQSRSERHYLKMIRRPLLLAGFTTVAAMLCLSTSMLPSKRQLGLFAAIGVAGAALAAVTLLPWMLERLSKPQVVRASLFTRLIEYVSLRCKKLVGPAGLLVLLFVMFALPGLWYLRFDADPSRLSALSEQVQADEQGLYETWGSLQMTFVMLTAPTEDLALEYANITTQTLKTHFDVQSISGVDHVLPAPSVQQENITRWNHFWSQATLDQLQQKMAESLSHRGLKPNAFAPFFDRLNHAGEASPISLQTLQAAELDWLLAGRMVKHDDAVSVLLVLEAAEVADTQQFVDGYDWPAFMQVSVLSRPTLASHTVRLIQHELFGLILLVTAVVLATLAVVYARLELILLTFLPMVGALVLTLGLMGWLGIEVNLFNALFVVFIFGIGVDYSVFLVGRALDRYRTGQDDSQAVTAVSACALTTLCGLGALVIATHPALRSVGITATIGVGASFICSIALVNLGSHFLLPTKDSEPAVPAPGLKQVFGGIWVCVYLSSSALLYLLVFRQPMLYLKYRGDRDKLGCFARWWLHHMARLLIKTYFYRRSRVRYVGLDEADFDKPAVLVANHLAGLDNMCLFSLPCEMVMVVKRWVWDMPVLGWLIRDAQFIVGDGDAARLLEESKKHLAAGRFVAVYPEGTRSRDAKVHRFRSGAFELAIQAGVDVLPVRLVGSQWCTPRGRLDIGDFDVMVHVLPRMAPPNTNEPETRIQFSKQVRQVIQAGYDADDRITQMGPSAWQRVKAMYRYQGPYVETYIASKLRFDPIYHALDSLVPTQGTIIDAGCGYGLSSNILSLQSRTRKVIGIDNDKAKLQIAKRAGRFVPDVNYVCTDLQDWPAGEADAVLLIDVLHYWSVDRQKMLIQKAVARLRLGGRLIFRENYVTQANASLGAQLGEAYSLLIGHNQRGEGLYFLPRETYVQWLASHGMMQVHDENISVERVMVFEKTANEKDSA